MAKRCKEDAEKTKEHLLDAAEKVFLVKGIAAASLEEIAQEAGLTRGAVYWHFDNKHALVKALHERVKLPLEVLLEQALQDADPVNGLKKHCVHVLRELGRDERLQHMMTIMLFRCEQADAQACNGDQIAKRSELISKFEKAFKRAAAAKQLAPGVTPRGAAIALRSYITGLFADYLRHDQPFDIATAAPELVEIFFRGITVGASAKPARRRPPK